ncbi:hypothetical protein PanWU01x14_129950 [Parasponia andersonii]|uniref:DUF1985 domain-containing protein n=1 Tax=Parasponia andersonii TaxID=3476 RepID=A0A2P5CRK2_PARAD|nr:hypothetical protein PanWU01x14_129950 [Parasponia andersonii]
MEYAMISGLNCSPIPDDLQVKLESFIKRHFPKKDPKKDVISIEDVRQKLSSMGTQSIKIRGKKNSSGMSDEKLKMVMLLFVSAVLLYEGKATYGIPKILFGLIDDSKAENLHKINENETTHTYASFVHEQVNGGYGKIKVEQQAETGFEQQPESEVEQQLETEEQHVQHQCETLEQPVELQPIQHPCKEPVLVQKRKPSHYITSPYTDPC